MIHNVLQAALKGVATSKVTITTVEVDGVTCLADSQHVLHPVHLGGPAPFVPAPDLVALAVRWAGALQDNVSEDERADYRQRLSIIHDALKGPFRLSWTGVGNTLDEEGTLLENTEILTHYLASAASRIHNEKNDECVAYVERVAERAAQLCFLDEIPSFLLRVDRDLVQAEYNARAILMGSDRMLQVRRVLWRADSGMGMAGHWIVLLTDGTYGAWHRTGKRRELAWFEGTVDDVLATVPDPMFEQAAKTVLP